MSTPSDIRNLATITDNQYFVKHISLLSTKICVYPHIFSHLSVRPTILTLYGRQLKFLGTACFRIERSLAADKPSQCHSVFWCFVWLFPQNYCIVNMATMSFNTEPVKYSELPMHQVGRITYQSVSSRYNPCICWLTDPP
jgi:hypothetical protein